MNINAWFETLQQDYIEQEGERLMALEREWHGRVPERMDRLAATTVSDARSRVDAGLPLFLVPPGQKSKGYNLLRTVKTTAIVLTAATAVAAGTYTLLAQGTAPGRSAVEATQPTLQNTAMTQDASEFQIISPGDEFEIAEQMDGNRVSYVWFKSSEGEILVELLFYEPEPFADAEAIRIGALDGELSERDVLLTLTLRYGTNYLVIKSAHLEREDVLNYAARLIEANA